LTYYRISNPKRTKLEPKAIKNVFIRYAENSKAYRLPNLESNVIIESTNVKFFENKYSSSFEIIQNNSKPMETQVNSQEK